MKICTSIALLIPILLTLPETATSMEVIVQTCSIQEDTTGNVIKANIVVDNGGLGLAPSTIVGNAIDPLSAPPNFTFLSGDCDPIQGHEYSCMASASQTTDNAPTRLDFTIGTETRGGQFFELEKGSTDCE